MNVAEVASLGNLASKRAPEVEDAAVRKLAKEFEAQFIAEMLKHSGLNETSSSFGGGEGEGAFASYLTQAYAEKLADAGGIGLAESIYQAMLSKGE